MKEKPSVALVTGAARRIGAEIVRTLHAAGMNIILHCHTSEREAHVLAKKLNQRRSDSVCVLSCDLTQPVIYLNQLIQLAIKKYGKLNVLVNNASSFFPTLIGQVSESDWDNLFATNVKAPFFLAQAAYPHLKKTKGVIINICDIHGKKPLRDYAVYCSAKAGLILLTQALAKEFAPAVRVNGVSPGGAMLWPEGKNQLTAEKKRFILNKIPLRRQGSARDIAKTVYFLIKDADYVTGQVWDVDGGRCI